MEGVGGVREVPEVNDDFSFSGDLNEQTMPIGEKVSWRDGLPGGSQFIKLPVGAVVTVKIEEIKKVKDKPDFDIKYKDGRTTGYHFEFVTDQGILTVNTWALVSALRDARVDPGMTIKVDHADRGVYKVTVL